MLAKVRGELVLLATVCLVKNSDMDMSRSWTTWLCQGGRCAQRSAVLLFEKFKNSTLTISLLLIEPDSPCSCPMIVGVVTVPDVGVCRAWYAPARAPSATYASCMLNRTVHTQGQSRVGVSRVLITASSTAN